MSDERDEIRSRIDIVDLVGREIQLKKTGKTWKGLCPFHPDKNPSFHVNSETGRYRCWSCGANGDIFNWEMNRRNVDFLEALQTLAKVAGVSLAKRTGVAPGVRLQQENAMDEALKFFREEFTKNTAAQGYCERRSISKEALDLWEMGYAPNIGEALAVRLKKAGFGLPECKALFLVDQDANGGYFDKFRGRLMFPIRDEKGQLVAFGGRVLGDGVPKYINSSDTPLYRKSRVLYGMNVAKDHISKRRQAVLVEGYLDVIACHLAGARQAVASLGTALSEDHARLLKRWCDEVVILYDSDDAGRKAAERAIDILEAEQLKVRIALMPAGQDPDTLLKTEGPEAVLKAIDGALTPVAYRLGVLERTADVQSVEFWTEAVAIIATAPTAIESGKYLELIAPKYPWERNPAKAAQFLATQVAGQRKQGSRPTGRTQAAAEYQSLKNRLTSAEIVLLRGILDENRKDVWKFACTPDLYASELGRRIGEALKATFGDPHPIGKPSQWLHRLEDEELRQTLADLHDDFRSLNHSDERMIDAITKLQEARDERLLQEKRRAGATSEELWKQIKLRKQEKLEDKPAGDRLF